MTHHDNHEEEREKEPKKQKRGIKPSVYFISLFIVAILSVGGTFLGLRVFGSQESLSDTESTYVTDSDQNTSTELTSFLPIQQAYTLLKESYFMEADDETLIEGAIEGMAESLEDPYTEYLDEVETEGFNDDISGSFEGIGAEVMNYGNFVRIVSPMKNSPAEEAGLQPGDVITHIDGESIEGLSLNEAVSKIRGEQGTEVILTIMRGDSELEVPVTRDSIPVETVYYEQDSEYPEVGYIEITSFSEPTYNDLVDAIENLQKQGIEKIVFDFRSNPGGLLTSALEISNIFVPEGEPIMEVEDCSGHTETYNADQEEYGSFKYEGDAVFLINEGSASASEIVAGAAQAYDIPLVGTKSFGKGTVQSVYPLAVSGELKVTSARWLTAEGEWINEEGITPNHEVQQPGYYNLLFVNPGERYEEGQASDEVKNIKDILGALGYNVDDSDEFNSQTTEAVQAFQSDHGIEITGVVEGQTAVQLVESLQKLVQENDRQYEEAVQIIRSIE